MCACKYVFWRREIKEPQRNSAKLLKQNGENLQRNAGKTCETKKPLRPTNRIFEF